MTPGPVFNPRAIAVAVGLVGLVALPAVSSGQSTTVTQPVPRQLSNERTLSRWAYPASHAPVYAQPTKSSSVVTRLHTYTEDHLPEVYLLLQQATDSKGRVWVQIRVPKRPNGRKGWVLRSWLGQFHVVRTLLVVNRHTLRVTLYKDGKKIFRAPVGVGRPSLPTPGGRFWVREKFRVRGNPVYGPFAIGTAAYAPTLTEWPNGGVVGLHGTNEPSLVPGRPSHGCIRMHNSAIARLFRRLPIGTPLHII